MMTIKLPAKWIDTITKMPESGMGAHHVDIQMKSGQTIRNVTVFNAEDCQSEIPFDPEEITEIRQARPE